MKLCDGVGPEIASLGDDLARGAAPRNPWGDLWLLAARARRLGGGPAGRAARSRRGRRACARRRRSRWANAPDGPFTIRWSSCRSAARRPAAEQGARQGDHDPLAADHRVLPGLRRPAFLTRGVLTREGEERRRDAPVMLSYRRHFSSFSALGIKSRCAIHGPRRRGWRPRRPRRRRASPPPPPRSARATRARCGRRCRSAAKTPSAVYPSSRKAGVGVAEEARWRRLERASQTRSSRETVHATSSGECVSLELTTANGAVRA